MIDALKTTVRQDYRFATEELNHLPYGEKKILLVTCHRRENYGEPMKQHHAGPAADCRGASRMWSWCIPST